MKRTLIAVAALVMAWGTAQAQKLTGAGATFPYPIYSKWFTEYSAAHPGVEVNYQSIGSGGGIRQVEAGLVDFGASDMPMTDEMLKASKVKLIHLPTVLGAVVPVFNVPGVTDLRFSPSTLANIYLAKITNWNDAAIAKDNPGVKLPDQKITVVHRADASGTTFIFTDYLSKVSKDWAGTVGKGTSVGWPTGVGGKGNEGVAGLVRQLPGAIGYVELIYALQNHITFGDIQNAAGNWVKASIDGVTDAAASAKMEGNDFRVSITNAPGPNAYPISSFTYLLIPVEPTNEANRKVLKDMLSWMLKSGESEVSALSYAPLPDSLVQKELAVVYSLK
ncbi:MAG TPA: phosphate ABC transporter substrate-binding protein PstS [Terracidiphilus sp.]|nr:phosphate ABC transporter substrate-binding protein PstS [Terracidiphilus sp.]